MEANVNKSLFMWEGHTSLFSWIAGSQAHFPRLGGREKDKNKNVASGISEQQKE
jgi:hypothetical protein